MTRTRWLWPILISGSLLAAWAMLFVWPASPLRLVLTWTFLLVAPGLAYVRLLRLRAWLVEAVLSAALSLAILIVVGTLLLIQAAWDVERGFLAVALITAGGVALQAAQIWRAQRQSAEENLVPGPVRRFGQWLAAGLAADPDINRPAYAGRSVTSGPAIARASANADRRFSGSGIPGEERSAAGFLSDVGGAPVLGIRESEPAVPVSRAVLDPLPSGEVWAPDEDWDLPSAEDLRGLTNTLPWMTGISRKQAPATAGTPRNEARVQAAHGLSWARRKKDSGMTGAPGRREERQ